MTKKYFVNKRVSFLYPAAGRMSTDFPQGVVGHLPEVANINEYSLALPHLYNLFLKNCDVTSRAINFSDLSFLSNLV
jgi:hypothetical protein